MWKRLLSRGDPPRVIHLPAEPVRRRVVSRRMATPIGMTALGIGGVAAVMLGVSLGNSAISQINPIHFQGAAVHPRDRGAAIDPNVPAVIPNRYEQLYGFAQGQQARAVDCAGCTFGPPAVPAAMASTYRASAPYFGSREERAQDEARERRAIDASYQQRLADAEARQAALAEVRRYADYRVSADERPPAAAGPARERPYYARNDVVLDDRAGDDDQK